MRRYSFWQELTYTQFAAMMYVYNSDEDDETLSIILDSLEDLTGTSDLFKYTEWSRANNKYLVKLLGIDQCQPWQSFSDYKIVYKPDVVTTLGSKEIHYIEYTILKEKLNERIAYLSR